MSLSFAARKFIATGYGAGLALDRLASAEPRDPDLDAAVQKALSETWWVADGPLTLEVTHLLDMLEARRAGSSYSKPSFVRGARKIIEQLQKQVIATVGRRETDRVEALLILLYVAQVDGGRTSVPTDELAAWMGTTPEEVEEMLRSARLDGLAELNRSGSGPIARIIFDGRAQVDEWLHDDAAPTVEAVRTVELGSSGSDGAIQELELVDVFSFGAGPSLIPLGKLNVLIGANGSGKTNILDAIELLAATPRDLYAAVRDAGGIRDVLSHRPKAVPLGMLKASISFATNKERLEHSLWIASEQRGGQDRFVIAAEKVESLAADGGGPRSWFVNGQHVTLPANGTNGTNGKGARAAEMLRVPAGRSLLSEPRAIGRYPELAALAAFYENILPPIQPILDRRDSRSLRRSQPADQPSSRLSRDGSNLALVINQIERDPTRRKALIERLKEVYEWVDEIRTGTAAGDIQLLLEEHQTQIPATRLSDGTLRLLCLLVVLCDPSPPPVILIEEPELGLHPDATGLVADLLREASEKSQIILTTHSVDLVDRFTSTPDVVLVVERKDGFTWVERQERTRLAKWLEDYDLGKLWRTGQIGGNRW